jgi:hypothetical protein
MVAVGCPVTNIVQPHLYQPVLPGALEDAGFEVGFKYLGEERKNFEAFGIVHDGIILAGNLFAG